MSNILLVIYSILELSGLGGWSTENLSLSAPEPSISLSEPGSYTYGAHIGYVLQFHPYVGIGVGADFQRYGTGTYMQGDAYWMGVSDTEGEKYNHRMHVYSLRDNIQQLYVNVPLSLRFFVPMNYISLEAQVGAKVGFPISSSGTYKGDIEHFGQYPQWGETELEQVPNHGFYRNDALSGTYEVNSQLQAFVFAKLGVLIPLNNQWQLSVHVGADYGLLKNQAGSGEAPFGCNNNDDPAHTFMSAYPGIIGTRLSTGIMHPLTVSGEIGIRFLIPHKKTYPCRCLDD